MQKHYRKYSLLLFLAFTLSNHLALWANSTTEALEVRLAELEHQGQRSERLDLLLELGEAQHSSRQFEQAIQTFEEAQTIAISLSEIDKQFDAIFSIGHTYQSQGSYNQALEYFNSLILEQGLYSPKQIAKVHHQISKVYRGEGKYELAYAAQTKALEIRKEINDQDGIARSHYQLGSLFYYQKNYSLALEYYQKTLDFGLEDNDLSLLYMSYGAIGSTYSSMGNLSSSISYNQLALELASKQENETAIAYALHNIASNFHQLDSFDQSLNHYTQALDLKRKLKDQWGEIATIREIGNLYIDQNKKEEGFSHLHQALEISQRLKLRPRLLECYDALANGYEKFGMGKESVTFLRKYINLKDSLMNESTLAKMGNIKNEYEIQLRNKELIKKDYQIAQLHQKALLASLIVLLSLLWLIYSRYKNAKKHSLQLKKKTAKIHQQNEALEKANALQKKSNKLLRKTNLKIQSQNKKLENSNQELQRFAYIASHDLKEPLRTIGSYASLINRRYRNELDEEAKEFLTFITTGINRMYNLLGEVMNYSKLETSMGDNDFGWIDTKELALEVKQSLREQFSEKNAQLILGELPMIHANRNHLLQVFQNLITNGLKYNSKEMPIIKIACERKEKSFVFSFRDNGIGIKKEYQEKIFEAFQRLHGKDKYEGTGIGLAICKKLVTNYNGEIWVDSQTNEGSTFYISLPATSEEPIMAS